MTLKLNFIDLPQSFLEGTKALSTLLGFELHSSGIPVRVEKSDVIKACLKEGVGSISYIEKHHFFRSVGLFVENAGKSSCFEITESPRFETTGVMLSSGGSLTVEAIKRFLDYMAVMGYNMLMMYTEDTYEMKDRPFFGYMKGAYSYDEFRECDDYADGYGIEMIPCIQTYGHMGQYLKWKEAEAIKDTATVLLADEEETYAFIEDMIRTASAPFKSKRIHIGMDEAWDMGRGAYLTKHGTWNPFDTFIRHLNRVIEITDKHGLVPMMWSDMFFRIASKSGTSYYDPDTVIPESIKAKIPENIQLVYWHYGECPGADEYMIDKHMETGRDVIFAGALWSWSGHLPEYYFSTEVTEKSLLECKKRNVKEIMTTLWYTTEGDSFTSLLNLQQFAEHSYADTVPQEKLKSRFEFCTGGSFEAFMDMSQYHNIFEEGREYFWNDRFEGKLLFWQDVMEGLNDSFLFNQPISSHYKKYAEKFAGYAENEAKWQELYAFAAATFECLSIKCLIAEGLKPAYDTGDKAFLKKAADEYLPSLTEKVETLCKLNRKLFFSNRKVFGWSVLDARYGTLEARIKTAIERIKAYLSGELDCLSELEVERLPMEANAFRPYRDMVQAGIEGK